MLRENWREGSSINAILTRDQWWEDYIYSWGNIHNDESWIEWCKDKMIIGPPRHRSSREEAELDEDYLTTEDIIRHCRPWSRTWPHPDDHSWCKVREVPDWAKEEFIASKREWILGPFYAALTFCFVSYSNFFILCILISFNFNKGVILEKLKNFSSFTKKTTTPWKEFNSYLKYRWNTTAITLWTHARN